MDGGGDGSGGLVGGFGDRGGGGSGGAGEEPTGRLGLGGGPCMEIMGTEGDCSGFGDSVSGAPGGGEACKQGCPSIYSHTSCQEVRMRQCSGILILTGVAGCESGQLASVAKADMFL